MTNYTYMLRLSHVHRLKTN